MRNIFAHQQSYAILINYLRSKYIYIKIHIHTYKIEINKIKSQ